MRQFTLRLNRANQKPIIELKTWYNFDALLDTGALFPVWTAAEVLITKVGGTLIKKGISFGGFGGQTTGNLYQLDKFILGDLIFPKMAIITCNDLEDVPYQLILSATMFSNLIYKVDDRNKKFNVTVPDGESTVRRLAIEDSNGRLHVLCNSEETSE